MVVLHVQGTTQMCLLTLTRIPIVHYLLQANATQANLQQYSHYIMVRMAIMIEDRFSSPGLKWLMSSYLYS